MYRRLLSWPGPVVQYDALHTFFNILITLSLSVMISYAHFSTSGLLPLPFPDVYSKTVHTPFHRWIIYFPDFIEDIYSKKEIKLEE